jgi:hypothetical protein
VSQQNDAIRRALDALKGDAGEHPGHEVLEAYVEGRLDQDQAAGVERLAARSQVVAEDIADLEAVHRAVVSERRPDVRWRRIAAVAAIAAGVLLAVWVTTPSRIEAPARIVSAEENARVTAAMTSGRVAIPAEIAALRSREGTLLGAVEPARFFLQTPVGSAVLETRPLFTWGDAPAEAYTVAVFDQNFSEVARGRTDSTSWRPEVDLPRGATYSWQVTAHRGAEHITEPKPPRPEARFTIVDIATAARIAEMQKRLADEPLALGVLLAEHGLIVEARIQLARAAQNPETAEIARRLYSSLDQGTPITTKPAQ